MTARGMIARAVEQVFACSSQLVDKGWQVSGEGGGGGGVGGVQYTCHFTQAHTSVKSQVSLMYQDTRCWSKHAHKNYNMQHHMCDHTITTN